MTEKQKYRPGTILQDQVTMSYWLVLCPSESSYCHVPINTIVNLINGQVRPLEWLEEPKPISHLEVMW